MERNFTGLLTKDKTEIIIHRHETNDFKDRQQQTGLSSRQVY